MPERKDEFLDRLWVAYTALIAGARKRVSQATIADQIARDSGMPTRQDDVSRWLRGKGRPSYEELPATADALGVRYQWLGFNDGPMSDGTKVEPDAPRMAHKPAKLDAEKRKGRA